MPLEFGAARCICCISPKTQHHKTLVSCPLSMGLIFTASHVGRRIPKRITLDFGCCYLSRFFAIQLKAGTTPVIQDCLKVAEHPPAASTRELWCVFLKNTHTAQTALVFLHFKFFTAILSKSSLHHFVCGHQLCVSRTDTLGLCWYSAISLRYCNGSTRKGKSFCVHTTLTHCVPQTLSGFVVTEDIHFSQVMMPSTSSMTRRNLLMRSGQATPVLLGGHLSRSMMSSSLPAHPSVLSEQFFDTVEITNPPFTQVESAWTRRI